MKVVGNENFLLKELPSIGILSIMYVIVEIFSDGSIVSPIDPTKQINNIELIVPVSAALIFSGLLGGSVVALGILLTEILYRIEGSVTDPIGLTVIFKSTIYFLGVWMIGRYANTENITHSLLNLIVNVKTWFRLIFNTIVCVIGIGLIPPISQATLFPLAESNQLNFNYDLFSSIFQENIYFVIVIIPITLLLYDLVNTLRKKRELRLDKKYHELQIQTQTKGPGKFVKAFFPENAFRIGEWVPLHVVFKHSWKASRSYEVEAISTSHIHPHFDKTPVLKEGETWTHVMYVLPLKQDQIDIKLRLTPSHSKKYKTETKNQTTINISGKTYVKRDLLLISLIFISEIIIFFFLFSFIWRRIVNLVNELILNTGISTNPGIAVPWTAILTIGLVEAIFFLPFLGIMYIVQRPNIVKSIPQELSFSHDISTHKYQSIAEANAKAVLKYAIMFLTVIGTITLAIMSTINLWYLSFTPSTSTNYLNNQSNLVVLTMSTLFLWIISMYILNHISYKLKLRTHSNYSLSQGKYISNIQTFSQFKVFQPTEVVLSIQNYQNNKGLRLLFKGNDTISPPLLELHVAPGETATAKLAITPLNKGSQNVLVIIYPLFDNDGNYMEIDDCRPLAFQNINFRALGETTIGITHGQLRTLKHLFGWGSLLASTITFTNQYIGVEEVINQWKESVPWLVTLQVPFLYIYYLFTNNFITKIQTY